jgi:hypothetical protein
MAAQYGYVTPKVGSYKPATVARPRVPAISLAAAGRTSAQDPFGLSMYGDALAPSAAPHSTQTGGLVAPKVVAPAAPATVAPPGSVAGTSGNTPTVPAGPQPYDINTDPALQQVQAMTGMNDQQAQAAALKQKQDQLLAYGDPTLVSSVLGDPTIAQAAAANPTSTVAQLNMQRDRNLKTLTEGLNQSNLLYSGYRVNQETQAGQDYQNALAQAAAGVNTNLGGIDAQLAATLGTNQQQNVQALLDAYGRHATDPGVTPDTPTDPTGAGAGGAGDPTRTGSSAYGQVGPSVAPDYLTALAMAARGARRPVGL